MSEKDTKPSHEPIWQGAAPKWTPRSANAAYTLAQTGDLSSAAQLCDAIRSDARVRGTLETRKNALFGCELEFDPAGHKSRSRSVIKALDDEGEWWRMLPEPALAQIFLWGLLLNAGIGELEWRREELLETDDEEKVILRDKRWLLLLHPKHPRNLRFDQQARIWQLMTQDGEIPITPGDGRWLMFSPFGANSLWQHGLYWPLALLWLSKTFSDFDWGRRNEARGRSALIGMTPEGSSNEDRDKYAAQLAELRTKLGIAIPPGYDLKAVEFGPTDHQTFKARIDWADGGIATLILGQNLTAEPRIQTLAAPKTNDKVRQDYLENDAESFATCLQQHHLRPYANARFGNPELAPWPKWKTAPPEDLTQAAVTIKTASEALEKLLVRGVPVDWALFCERFNIPVFKGQPLAPPSPSTTTTENKSEPANSE